MQTSSRGSDREGLVYPLHWEGLRAQAGRMWLQPQGIRMGGGETASLGNFSYCAPHFTVRTLPAELLVEIWGGHSMSSGLSMDSDTFQEIPYMVQTLSHLSKAGGYPQSARPRTPLHCDVWWGLWLGWELIHFGPIYAPSLTMLGSN